MSRIADILIRAIDTLTPTDERDLQSGFSILEDTVKDLGSSIGPAGRGSRVSFGSVVADNGLTLFNPKTGYMTAYMSPEGDFSLGYDISRAAYTSFKVLSNDTYYNEETLGYGDVLLGDNSSGKANLLWDRSTGRLNFRGGTTVNAYIDSDGYLTATGATITGTITATAGAIGGWSIAASTISSSNITLDSSNDYIEVGSSPLTIHGGTGSIYSYNYASGVSGWYLGGGDDYAEFQNVLVRGELVSTVFTTSEIQATGGTLAVTKKVGKNHAQFTTPTTSTTIRISNDGGGSTCSFANADIVRVKTGTTDFWGNLSAKSQQSDYAEFTLSNMSGTTGAVIRPGTALLGYDSTSGGSIYLSADSAVGEAANMSILTHGVSPWNDEDLMVRIGNLYGSYGAGLNDYWGFAVGDYSSGDYLSYNADGSGAFVLSAADGAVTIDNASGITLQATTAYLEDQTITFHDTGASLDVARLYSIADSSNDLILMSRGGTIRNAQVTVQAETDGDGMDSTISIFAAAGTTSPEYATLAVIADDGAGINQVKSTVPVYQTTDGSGGGYYAGASNDVQWYRGAANAWRTPDSLVVDGGIDVGGTAPATGWIKTTQGIRVLKDGSAGGLYAGASYDVQWYRSAANLWRTPDSVQIDTDLQVNGNLDVSRSSTVHTGLIYVPLDSYLTSTSFDGDSFSSVSKTKIDMSSVFSITDTASISAYHIQVFCRDSGSDSTSSYGVVLWNNNTNQYGEWVSCSGLANDAIARGMVIVPADASGDIYYQFVASGTSTLDVWIRVMGYFV